MNYSETNIIPYGEQAFLIQWPPEIAPEGLFHILSFKEYLEQYYWNKGVDVEIINTYHEILLYFKKRMDRSPSEIRELQQAFRSYSPSASRVTSTQYYLPVCYVEKFGWDLKYLENKKGLTREEIIELHTSPTYLVYFIGFLPGFLYLGGLDARLKLDRKKSPREKVPRGAVGIAGVQTGIYPQCSPGGWQIIGNCPVPLFNVRQQPPCIFKAGDVIRFYAISEEEYEKIASDISKGVYQIKKEAYEY